MGTTLRAELSEKNPYWIEKHRLRVKTFLPAISYMEESICCIRRHKYKNYEFGDESYNQ